MDLELVPYELVDAEEGHVWQMSVTKAEAAALDLDHKKRFRLIKDLKDGKAVPVYRWDVTATSPDTSLATGAAGTEGLPSTSKPARAQGPTGAVWKGNNNATSFLNCCLHLRKWLRGTVPQHLWQQISDAMYNELGLNYSWEQLKAKMKTLKRQFSEAKKGQHGGDQWTHFWLMAYIFDEAIVDGNTTLAPPGFNPLGQEVIEFDVPLLSSTVVSPVAEESLSSENKVEDEDTQTVFVHLVHSMGAATMTDNADSNEAFDAGLNDVVDADVDDDGVNDDAVSHIVDDSILAEDISNNNTNASKHFSAVQVDHILTDVNRDVNLLRSPAKKKKKTAAFTISSSISPRKTPTKRKVPKSQLQFSISDANKFLSQCRVQKEHLMKNSIPLKTWKDISAALGGSITWQVCRDKFYQMDESFKNTWLPLNGSMGGGRWPHFTDFCALYDIPEDYFTVVNASGDLEEGIEELDDGEDEDEQDTSLWKHEVILLLLTLFKPRRPQFEGSKSGMKHNYLYAKISHELKEKGYSRTWKQVKSKITRLKKKFREEFDNCWETGSAPSQWPYYKEMLDIYNGTASLIAPVGLSAGMGVEYTVDGEKIEETRTGTRSRPSLQTKKKKEPTAKRPIYKNWQQELQEKSIEQKDKLVKQVEIMNAQLSDSSKDRKAFYAAFAAKYL